MTEEGSRAEEVLDIEFLHEIGSRMAAADPFHAVLERVVEFVSTVVMCDSCFVYVLEGEKLVLRASKNPHADLVDELDLALGQGITGWVAMHQKPVAIASQAWRDPSTSVPPGDRRAAGVHSPAAPSPARLPPGSPRWR